ncbi:HIT domain-containing protein [Candidatus Woesearchaeota archaeon]|nr:HIT domain-containing protein [Candidatus Woesearchaeota archaeon]
MPEQKTPQQIMEEQKANCPFCKIVKGDFPSKKVFEDDKILAVLDINPGAKGHALVLPKEHYPIITMIPPETFAHLFEKTREIAKCIEEAMVCKGIEWFIASGGAAGQQVPHFMIHLIPRDDNDGLSNFDLKTGMVTEEQQKEIKEKIEQNMSAILGKKTGGEKVTKEKLIQIIESSPQLKEALINKTEEFKNMVKATPQLQVLFKDFDVDEIAAELKGEKKPEQKKEEKEEAEEKKEEKEKVEEKKEEEKEEDVKELLGGEKEEEKEEPEEETEDTDEEPEDNEEKGGADLDAISKLF